MCPPISECARITQCHLERGSLIHLLGCGAPKASKCCVHSNRARTAGSDAQRGRGDHTYQRLERNAEWRPGRGTTLATSQSGRFWRGAFDLPCVMMVQLIWGGRLRWADRLDGLVFGRGCCAVIFVGGCSWLELELLGALLLFGRLPLLFFILDLEVEATLMTPAYHQNSC